MEWISENIRLIVIIAGAIAYWLNQRRNSRQEEEDVRPPSVDRDNQQDIEQAERTRRIQEEIRRKILERMGGAPSQPAPSVPMDEPPPLYVPEVRVEQPEPELPAEPRFFVDEEMLERQRHLAEQMRELEKKRRVAAVHATEVAAAHTATASLPNRAALLAELQNPLTARRAIVMREVLGPPVGLR